MRFPKSLQEFQTRFPCDVEADETCVGGDRPGQVGRGLVKTGVAVAVEDRGDTAGATRLAVVPHASTRELTSFVRGVADAREARVHTDDWRAYARWLAMASCIDPGSRGTARGPARSRLRQPDGKSSSCPFSRSISMR